MTQTSMISHHCISILAIFFMLSGSHTRLEAQELARELSQFIGNNARPFLQPIVDGLNTDVHAGMFSSAMSEGFHIGISLVAMGVFVPDDQKTFRPTPYSKTVEFTYNGIQFLGDLDIAPAEFPTAAGLGKRQTYSGRLRRVRPKGSPYVPGVYDFIQYDATVSVGGYRDVSTVFLATPQLSFGTYLHTNLIVRFLPAIRVRGVGEISSFGVGLKHNVGHYLSIPVDLSGQLMYQSLSLNARDNEFNAELNQSSFGAQFHVGKSLAWGIFSLGPYVGIGYESSTVDVRYEYADPYVGRQSLEFMSGAQFRFVGGMCARLSQFTFSADYNLALMNGFSVGLGVEI